MKKALLSFDTWVCMCGCRHGGGSIKTLIPQVAVSTTAATKHHLSDVTQAASCEQVLTLCNRMYLSFTLQEKEFRIYHDKQMESEVTKLCNSIDFKCCGLVEDQYDILKAHHFERIGKYLQCYFLNKLP
jgi:hypothetical protein